MSFLPFELMADMWFDQEKLDVPLMINGNAINNVTAVKYLGVILTSGRVGSLFLEKSRW